MAPVLPSCRPFGTRPARACSPALPEAATCAARCPRGRRAWRGAAAHGLERLRRAFANQLAGEAVARVALVLDQGAQPFAASLLAGAVQGVSGLRECSAPIASSKPGCSKPVGREHLLLAGTGQSGVQVGRRKPVIQGGPGGKILSRSPRAGFGRQREYAEAPGSRPWRAKALASNVGLLAWLRTDADGQYLPLRAGRFGASNCSR